MCAFILASCENPEQTAFGIINRYVQFMDKIPNKTRENWPLNPMWRIFLGENRRQLKLTAAPEPYSRQKTLNWLSHQVAPSCKMLLELDRKSGTNILQDMLAATELQDKHKKIIQQQLQGAGEMVNM